MAPELFQKASSAEVILTNGDHSFMWIASG
jgi:hypothetical protein